MDLDHDVESIDQDNLGDGDNHNSFNDLKQDAESCNGTLDLEHDYVRYESDNDCSICVNDTLVINGNGHCFDGANFNAGITFDAVNHYDEDSKINVVINDITFKNFQEYALNLCKGKVTLNNVNFTNCSGSSYSLIFVEQGVELLLNNSNCFCNYSKGLISISYAKLTILNSNFFGENCTNSAIIQNRGQLIIENSIFENFNAKNGAIINFKGDHFSIKNSKFMNSIATFNGGAIIANYFPIYEKTYFKPISSDDMLIENCIFHNLSSATDGGAVYIDLGTGSEGVKQTLNIINSNFTDCTSRFGGAIAIDGGDLNIENSNFINNSAGFEGAALFTSWCNANIVNSNLVNNTAEKNAGAIYFDKGKLTIKYSNITGNKALKESNDTVNAIYAYDVEAYFLNSTFDNGGLSVYADFASDSKLENVTKNDDVFLMDNQNYIVSIETKGIKLNITKNSVVVDEIPESYDLRDLGWLTPAKIQGDNYDCWAFATAASLESSLFKSTGVLYELSQNYIQKLQLKYSPVGDIRVSSTGFAYSGLGYALSWIGTLPLDAPYDDRGMLGGADFEDARIHLQDAMIIFGGRNDTNELIKQAILRYGGVSVQELLDEPNPDVNWTGEAFANHDIHFVSIIGWDDNGTGDGGVVGVWLTKDSSNAFGKTGYNNIYLLATDYYAIVPQNAGICYIFENDIDYHVNYQTDLTGLTGFDGNYTFYSNEFTSKYSELIGAVGTYFNESGIDYSFDIYVNGEKVHSQTGVSEFAGFRTIVLNNYIPVKAGDKFKVVFKNNALPFQAFSRQHYVAGMSMVSADGESWSDITLVNRTVCLKVYTVKDDTKIVENKDIAVDYDGGSYFTVKVTTADGHTVGAGLEVKFTINGKTTTVKTDSNGIAKIKITQLPGKYAITTAYKGESVKNTVTVKQVLTASKVTVKKTAKNLVLKATLKINGKPVSGKAIKFTLNGKTYTAKTNKKGVAQVKIGKKALLKLKNAKKYTVKVTYLKDTIKTTVKAYDVIVLKAKKISVKKTAKKLKLKATLKLNGKAAKGKKITFKLNGKKYKAKTKKKGIAKKTLKKKVIKKLKKGKKYKVKVTYGKKTVKTTIKVKK